MESLSANIFSRQNQGIESTDVFKESQSAYFSLILAFNERCGMLKKQETVDFNPVMESLQKIIAIIRKDDRMLLGLANAPYSYVMHHAGASISEMIVVTGVNIMIYSLKISLEFGVADNHLGYIGIAGLCNNIGLLDSENLDSQEKMENLRKTEEYELSAKKYVKKIKIDDFHTESIEFLNTLAKSDKNILSKTSLQESMYQYAIIIHLCSEFVKLTHKGSFGEVMTPIDAMKKIRGEMNSYFNQDIIKLFFNKLSIYPLGSFVKLSSGDTAKIIGINENFIMRPVIAIVLDTDGREKIPPMRVNLREKPNIYIKHAVINEELTERFISFY
ncbi:MAG TPA: hypothetical protein DCZ94_08045 [Lentisphaeria bacterium]|nr:MAG: hypothetical protein A2X48_19520 [Lentisphaerae bacterium GWF2_49_21]HBC86889.1 hypothetical protein [Lentisphaeria bacterium]